MGERLVPTLPPVGQNRPRRDAANLRRVWGQRGWVIPVPTCHGRSLEAHTQEVCHPLKDPRVAPQRARSQRNGPRDPEAPLPGASSIQGCGCGLHPGRVVPIRPFSEKAVSGGHAGECAEPTLCGSSSSQRKFYLLFSKKGITLAARAKRPRGRD
ncbi:uncharacterized protein LOC103105268 isoform X3 [Monodelphis domestica]|uniref:uncharacterized protein LOC103105268 isoform X3 n=1 Tax=Monodelphis domestica TaxID=13616 RepID=UPI0024E22452|nr:uncharacterized protein LOC103105268 isoform X3 [Monodelphis domestica]